MPEQVILKIVQSETIEKEASAFRHYLYARQLFYSAYKEAIALGCIVHDSKIDQIRLSLTAINYCAHNGFSVED